MTLPQPGQWVRVRHACPDVTHDEPVEVVTVIEGTSLTQIATRRCDGTPMNLYAYRDGVPVAGDEWDIEPVPDTCNECWVVRPCFCDEETP
jgi:hypothetical protein